MKMICPHCCGEQQYSIKVLIQPDCKKCGKNMTRSINKKFSRCKGIARCLALLPIGIGLFVQSTFWNILGLIISLLLFALVELIFMKTAHEFKSQVIVYLQLPAFGMYVKLIASRKSKAYFIWDGSPSHFLFHDR